MNVQTLRAFGTAVAVALAVLCSGCARVMPPDAATVTVQSEGTFETKLVNGAGIFRATADGKMEDISNERRHRAGTYEFRAQGTIRVFAFSHTAVVKIGKMTVEIPPNAGMNMTTEGDVASFAVLTEQFRVSGCRTITVMHMARVTADDCDKAIVSNSGRLTATGTKVIEARRGSNIKVDKCDKVLATDNSFAEIVDCKVVNVEGEAQAKVEQCGELVARDRAVIKHRGCSTKQVGEHVRELSWWQPFPPRSTILKQIRGN